MAECELCGDNPCRRRACIEALGALADYYDAEAKLRSAALDVDRALGYAKVKVKDAGKDPLFTTEQHLGITRP